MLILELTPDSLPSPSPSSPYQWQKLEDNGQAVAIVHVASQAVVARIEQAESFSGVARFFHGKGGIATLVATPTGLTYIALPGSTLSLPGIRVEMPGEPITPECKTASLPQQSSSVQTITQQAMILGAGLATRFEPVSGDSTGYPKPGVPLYDNHSVISAIAEHLKRQGFTRIIVNTCYKPQSLKSSLALISGIEVVYVDEAAPTGTAGGLLSAFERGLIDTQSPILIIQGDAVTNCDLSFLLETHAQQQASVTIGGQIVRDEHVDKFGMIETNTAGGDGQSGAITSFKEKPSLAEAGNTRFANAGFYILDPKVFALFQQIGETLRQKQALYDYAQDFFPVVLAASKAGGHTFWAQALEGYWSDIGNPWQYCQTVGAIYNGCLGLTPDDLSQGRYQSGVIYWPGTQQLAHEDHAELSGNIIVTRPFNESF